MRQVTVSPKQAFAFFCRYGGLLVGQTASLIDK